MPADRLGAGNTVTNRVSPALTSLQPPADSRMSEMNPFVSASVKKFACIRVARPGSGKHFTSFKNMRIFVLISGKITNSK